MRINLGWDDARVGEPGSDDGGEGSGDGMRGRRKTDCGGDGRDRSSRLRVFCVSLARETSAA